MFTFFVLFFVGASPTNNFVRGAALRILEKVASWHPKREESFTEEFFA